LVWIKNLDKTILNNLSIIIRSSSKKFVFKGDFYLLRNFIFFNEYVEPEQYKKNLTVWSFEINKRIELWKIRMDNKLVYQESSNSNVLNLPKVVFNNTTWLEHMFSFKKTGGQLLTMIGFNMKYNSKYYASAYMPAITTFYNQNEKQLGNYPYFDVFLNVKLKQVRFYLKMEHVNSGWIERNYFSVLHYPLNERNIKIGLSWTFYD